MVKVKRKGSKEANVSSDVKQPQIILYRCKSQTQDSGEGDPMTDVPQQNGREECNGAVLKSGGTKRKKKVPEERTSDVGMDSTTEGGSTVKPRSGLRINPKPSRKRVAQSLSPDDSQKVRKGRPATKDVSVDVQRSKSVDAVSDLGPVTGLPARLEVKDSYSSDDDDDIVILEFLKKARNGSPAVKDVSVDIQGSKSVDAASDSGPMRGLPASLEAKDQSCGDGDVLPEKPCQCACKDGKTASNATFVDFNFSASPSLEGIRLLHERFVKERGWGKFHSPRNVLLAMVGEVGEIAELFQWKGECDIGLPDWTDSNREGLEDELADVMIYLVRLANLCHVDLPAAVVKKMSKNEKKYPVEKVFGSSRKYTEYKD